MISCQRKSWVLGINLYPSNTVLNKCRFSSRYSTQCEGEIPRREYFLNKEGTVEVVSCKSFSKENVTSGKVVSRVSNTEDLIRSSLSCDLDSFIKYSSHTNFFDASYIINLKNCRLIFFGVYSYSTTKTKTIISDKVRITKDLINSYSIPILSCIEVFECCKIT